MKNVLIASVLLVAISGSIEAKKITLEIPDIEISVVENDVVDAEQWIRDAWAGKVNRCEERMINEEIKQSVLHGESIPAGRSAIINKALNRPTYKNRKQREQAKQN